MQNEQPIVPERRLGRLPARASRKSLLFSDFVSFLQIPAVADYWTKKKPIPLRSYGNHQYGNCTRAKQAVAATRMERIEQRRLVDIADDEVIRVYVEMSNRRYGGGDNGAYEEDALSDWRKPDLTFRDTNGNPYTIDAFLRLNTANQRELKAAIAMTGARGIAVCFNLPQAWAASVSPGIWDVPPAGQPMVGPWMAGTWGGHSMWCHGYNEIGPIVDHTWDLPPQQVTWDGMAAYCDEAYVVFDSIDAWRKRTWGRRLVEGEAEVSINLGGIVEAVNGVSSQKLKQE